MINSFDRFIVQLNAYRQMIENNEKKAFEFTRDIEFETITESIISRKHIEYFKNNDLNIPEQYDQESVRILFRATDMMIEKNKFAKKLFDAIEIIEQEGRLVIKSSPPGLLSFYLTELANIDRKISKYEEDELLYQSLVVSLCSTLENYSSCILREFYFNYYGGDLVDGKTISFRNMKDFETIDEVRSYLIDIELEEIFRGSFNDWLDKIDKHIGLYGIFKELKELKNELNELFQRRNLYVHSDGIANQRYMQKTIEKYRKGVENGKKIIITKEYLLEKIMKVESLGLYMFYSFMYSFNRKEKDWFFPISNRFVRLLSRDNDAVAQVYNKARHEKAVGAQGNLYATINYFLYYYLNDRISEVRNELEQQDFSVYTNQFQMAKAILLNSEERHELIQDFFDEITDDGEFLSCYNWPLMNKVREEEPTKSYFDEKINLIFDNPALNIEDEEYNDFEVI